MGNASIKDMTIVCLDWASGSGTENPFSRKAVMKVNSFRAASRDIYIQEPDLFLR